MRFLFVIPLLVSAGFAVADDISQCDGSNVDMTNCIYDHYKAADKELNVVWKQVLATIEPSEFLPPEVAADWTKRLTAAQKAWVTYKEEDCNGAVAYEWYGGTGLGGAVGTCLYEKTQARIDDLKARYLDR